MRTNNPLFWHSWTLRPILESPKCSGFTMMTPPQGSFSGMILLSASQTPLPPISYWIWHDACCWSAHPGCTYFPRHSMLWSRTEILNYKVNLPVPRSSVVLQVPHTFGIGIVKQQHGFFSLSHTYRCYCLVDNLNFNTLYFIELHFFCFHFLRTYNPELMKLQFLKVCGFLSYSLSCSLSKNATICGQWLPRSFSILEEKGLPLLFFLILFPSFSCKVPTGVKIAWRCRKANILHTLSAWVSREGICLASDAWL